MFCNLDKKSISKRIKDEISRKGLKIANICNSLPSGKENTEKHIDISRPTLTKICEGIVSPTIDQLCDIADFLGVSVPYLLGIDKCTTPSKEITHKTIGFSEESIDFLIKQRHVCAWLIDYLAKNSPELFDLLLENIIRTFDFAAIYKLSKDKDLFGGEAEVLYNHFFPETHSADQYKVYSDALVVSVTDILQRIKDDIDYIDYGECSHSHSVSAAEDVMRVLDNKLLSNNISESDREEKTISMYDQGQVHEAYYHTFRIAKENRDNRKNK